MTIGRVYPDLTSNYYDGIQDVMQIDQEYKMTIKACDHCVIVHTKNMGYDDNEEAKNSRVSLIIIYEMSYITLVFKKPI